MPERLVIVMAVYQPDMAHLEAQIASFADQSRRPDKLIAVISDLVSGPVVARLAEGRGLECRLVVPDTPLDPVRAFEAGLTEALADRDGVDLIALSDQDDIWHPDRLAAGCAALARPGALLVHSDARIVDGRGNVLHRSLFRHERRIRAPGLRDLLYRNTVTGMTVLMRRAVAEAALPFPPQEAVHFYHDLWLALVARSARGLITLDRPHVDYRQHGGNAVGAERRGWLRWRGARAEAAEYGVARYLAQCLSGRMGEVAAGGLVPAQAIDLGPLGPYLPGGSGGGTHFTDGLRHLASGRAALARTAFGHGAVRLARGGWILKTALNEGRAKARREFDAKLFALAPGCRLPPEGAARAPDPIPDRAASIIDQRCRPRWAPAFQAEEARAVLLLPSLNPSEVFAGLATAMDLGIALARHGMPVRFVATDLPIASRAATRRFILGRGGDRAVAPIDIACGLTDGTIPAHAGDRLIATAWWTAHVANTLLAAHPYEARRFYYLIQDHEPHFYPWGAEFAGAEASYRLPLEPIFNTTLLRSYFAAEGHDFATDAPAFRPAIDIDRFASLGRGRRAGPRRIAVYGRPEVARNLFPLAVDALEGFLTTAGLAPEEVEIASVGLAHGDVALTGGHVLRSLGKLPWEAYPAFLAGTDVGLSLMLSPHPSHVPIEMAAAGVRVVTNGFGPKDLSRLSNAILSVPPEAPALAEALARAWTAPPVAPAERRIDLSPLGVPLGEVAADLARDFAIARATAPA